MTLYKLTDEFGQTRNQTLWGDGVTHSGTGLGKLCGKGYIHAYEHPLVAVFMNPVHANFANPQLWLAKGEIALRDGQSKCGCVTLTTVRRIELPRITTDQRVEIAIRCALEVYHDASFVDWTNAWLSGKDRSAKAAWAAEDAAEAAARAAARAAEAAAEDAAWAAARAAARAAEAAADSFDLVGILESVVGAASVG